MEAKAQLNEAHSECCIFGPKKVLITFEGNGNSPSKNYKFSIVNNF